MSSSPMATGENLATAENRTERQVVMYLAFLSGLLAFGIDGALPAFDEIKEAFGLAPDSNSVSLIITTYFMGAALGQLVYGPFADRFGRAPVLRFGLGVYTVGALGATFSDSMPMLLTSRFVWGLGAAAPAVLRSAFARDLYDRETMARVMSVVMAVFLLVPIIAPSFGQILVSLGGWRWTMAGPGVIVLIALAWSFRFGETLAPERRQPLALGPSFRAFRRVFQSRVALGYTLALSFGYGAFYVFLGSSQPIFDEIFGRGHQFHYFFAATSAVNGIGLYLGSRMVRVQGARRVAFGANVAMITMSTIILIVVVASNGVPNVFLWFGLLTLANTAQTMITPSATALALDPVADIAGTASAVLGVLTVGGGALLASIVDSQIGSTVTPMALGYVGYGLLSFAFFLWARSADAGEPLGH